MRNPNELPIIIGRAEAARIKEARAATGIQFFEYMNPKSSNDEKSISAYWLSIKWK